MLRKLAYIIHPFTSTTVGHTKASNTDSQRSVFRHCKKGSDLGLVIMFPPVAEMKWGQASSRCFEFGSGIDVLWSRCTCHPWMPSCSVLRAQYRLSFSSMGRQREPAGDSRNTTVLFCRPSRTLNGNTARAVSMERGDKNTQQCVINWQAIQRTKDEVFVLFNFYYNLFVPSVFARHISLGCLFLWHDQKWVTAVCKFVLTPL